MTRSKKIPTTKEPPFHIDAVLDGDGYTYSVSPWSEDWLLAKFPHAKPKRCVFIAQDTKADFEQAHQRIAPILAASVAWLTESEVRTLGDVPFTKPYPLEILFTWRASENTSKMPAGASAEPRSNTQVD